MGQKYEKPYVRDLGDIKNAQGYCDTLGSSAHVLGAKDCTNGSQAIGSYCGFGGDPNSNPSLGCETGTLPSFSGCINGKRASVTCASGETPT